MEQDPWLIPVQEGNGKPKKSEPAGEPPAELPELELPPGSEGFEYIPTSDPLVILYEICGEHWYWHMGEKVWMRSVTNITGSYPKGEGFYRWLARQGSLEKADEEKEAGGDRGTAVHSGIGSLLRGETLKRVEFPEEAWPHLRTFVNWYEDTRPTVLANEKVVYDLRRRIAGTLDLLIEVDGRIGVVDEKTAKYIYRSAEHQSNEYAVLLNNMQDEIRADFAGVLRTNSKHRRGYEYKVWDVCEKMHKVFVGMHFVQHDFDPRMEPQFPEQPPRELVLPQDDISEPSVSRSSEV